MESEEYKKGYKDGITWVVTKLLEESIKREAIKEALKNIK